MTAGGCVQTEHFDDLIIGSGEGGKYLAWHLARGGSRTAVIERKLIGGSCPNTNCLPSKSEIWSAEVAHLARHAGQYGTTTGTVSVDMARVLARKREMVSGLVAMHLDLFRQSGARLIMGDARFVSPKTVEVALNDGGVATFTGDRVFINVGTHAIIPAIPGLAAAAPMTNIELLELDRLPQHLFVLGGGYVGLEMAQAYRRFGSEVTILESGPHIAGREDADVADEITRSLRDEAITIHSNCKVTGVDGRSGDNVAVQSDLGVIKGSDILVAAGRTPNTNGIGLNLAGVELDGRGYITVNDRLETTAPDTWAIGECAGSEQFTHVSFDDFRIIRDNLAGGSRSKKGRLIPYCMFTDPQLGRVGLSETEAKSLGIAVRVAKLPIAAVPRTRTTSETKGFMKVLVGADDRIVGFAMIGADAGDVMATVQTAMLANIPYQVLREAIFAHPTMTEGLGPLLSRLES
ncbi:mercuric reductase [Hyphomicrobium methylovorum]|uniref:FAD-dependent oxidoreductase n=1 Tax=Hyphomicrobium methylovorum TaxID=84 RepID=UPI0015E738A4|nr:FAD-dependent oxidoreductase [Hyphomicrobium methylovorum]MBA2125714.1 mercuric reductase [Hyphomicrobium methylovorum]